MQMKEKGSLVSSGSLVASGYIQITAEKPPAESFQARIADAVRDAQGTLSDAEEQVGEHASVSRDRRSWTRQASL